MQIVAILGSPRKGNSSAIAGRFLTTAEGLGARTRSFTLNDLSYRGCQACFACKTGADHCVINDDLAPVLDAIRDADVVVLATPVYFGDVTGQFKSFFDRAFSFFTPDYRTAANPSRLAPGKKLVFVQVQGQPDPAFFDDLYPRYDKFFRRIGFGETLLLRGIGLAGADDAAKRAELLEETDRTVARVLARGETDW